MKYYFLFIILMLAGCINQPAAPIVDLDKSGNKHTVQVGETLYAIAWRYKLDYHTLAQANQIQSPYVIKPGQVLVLKRTPVKKTHGVAIFKQPPVKSEWIWPAPGTLLKPYGKYGQQINKGIDINGKFGEPILSALGGKVVYSGTGLKGYGQLIIIKHNETFLSAYAHNSRLLVKEGQMVKQGQIIAYMGQTDSHHVKLHFEIRKNGQPVDPLPLLPSRT